MSTSYLPKLSTYLCYPLMIINALGRPYQLSKQFGPCIPVTRQFKHIGRKALGLIGKHTACDAALIPALTLPNATDQKRSARPVR